MPGHEFFGEEERKEVNDVLETGVLMRYGHDNARKGIWKTKELEQALCNKLGAAYALVTNNGTSALTTAMAALGIGAGDEVIMPTFTFVASFECVLSVYATPVLVDIDDTLTLDPAAVRAAITPRTKAIMPVHMCGAMADLDALKAICDEFNLILLEDACQATGASYKGRALGTIGHAGTFSFDYAKTITCGEGGAIVTNSREVYLKCDGYADHGHDHQGSDRGLEEHPFPGLNYRISELNSAVGLAQFRKLDLFLSLLRRNKKVFKTALATVPQVRFRRLPDEAGDSATHLSFFLPDETTTRAAAAALKAAGIACFYWYDNNWHYIRKWDHFKAGVTLTALPQEIQTGMEIYKTKTFPASDAIISRCISIPVALGWSEEEVANKAEKIRLAVAGIV